MIAYEYAPALVLVKLDNKLIGHIKKVNGGWQYFPKGESKGGEVYQSVGDCQISLEEL